MRIVSISVTEASRNFADCVNRARYQGTVFFLHKNGVPVARITPIDRSLSIGGEPETGREPEPRRETTQNRNPPVPDIW
jgi:prevent-host-death family protein